MQTKRVIFKPDEIAILLINGAKRNGFSPTELLNDLIRDSFLPVNYCLRIETELIMKLISEGKTIDDEMLKGIIVRCILALRNNPIANCKPLEQIMMHFTTGLSRAFRYDYVSIVNEQQDLKLQYLNNILATVDSDFNSGTRELGERCKFIFKNWSKLSCYSDIYELLSIIVELEKVYSSIDLYEVLNFIRWLDKCIQNSSVVACKEAFNTDVSLLDKYNAVNYEIQTYQTATAYRILTADNRFENVPEEIREYFAKVRLFDVKQKEVSEESLSKINDVNRDGKKLFKELQKNTATND